MFDGYKITCFSGLSDEDDIEEEDNHNLQRLKRKRKRVDDDGQYGEFISVDISICNYAPDEAHATDGGSDTAGIAPRDLSDDDWSASDADPGPIKIGPPKKGTKCQYHKGKKFL